MNEGIYLDTFIQLPVLRLYENKHILNTGYRLKDSRGYFRGFGNSHALVL
jgi:hypothetical protein